MLGDEDEEELYITNRNELRNQLGAKKVVHMRDTDDEGCGNFDIFFVRCCPCCHVLTGVLAIRCYPIHA